MIDADYIRRMPFIVQDANERTISVHNDEQRAQRAALYSSMTLGYARVVRAGVVVCEAGSR